MIDELKSDREVDRQTLGQKTKMQKVAVDTKNSSQTIGLAIAVILVWVLKEFAGVEAPTMVEQAITAVIVVLATRFGDDK